MTNTELITQALEYAEWADANIYEVPITLPDVLREMADRIEEQERIINKYKWINVKDKLPAENDITEYLLWDGENMFIGYYRHDAHAWDNSCMGWIHNGWDREGNLEPVNITHYMPLPEPPTL